MARDDRAEQDALGLVAMLFVAGGMRLVVAPGTLAGLGPWWLTGWAVSEAPPLVGAPLRIVGAVLVLAGAAALSHPFGRFVLEGLRTPAPVRPPECLVIGGCTATSAIRCTGRCC